MKKQRLEIGEAKVVGICRAQCSRVENNTEKVPERFIEVPLSCQLNNNLHEVHEAS